MAECSMCGSILMLSKWNSDTDILLCDNVYCSKYHNPIIPQETRDRPKKLKKPDIAALYEESDTSVTARLFRAKARLLGEYEESEGE